MSSVSLRNLNSHSCSNDCDVNTKNRWAGWSTDNHCGTLCKGGDKCVVFTVYRRGGPAFILQISRNYPLGMFHPTFFIPAKILAYHRNFADKQPPRRQLIRPGRSREPPPFGILLWTNKKTLVKSITERDAGEFRDLLDMWVRWRLHLSSEF